MLGVLGVRQDLLGEFETVLVLLLLVAFLEQSGIALTSMGICYTLYCHLKTHSCCYIT